MRTTTLSTQKGFAHLGVILSLVAVLALGGFAFSRVLNADEEPEQVESVQQAPEQPEQTEVSEATVTNFAECDGLAYPVDERDGAEYCTGPDGTVYENILVTEEVANPVELAEKVPIPSECDYGEGVSDDVAWRTLTFEEVQNQILGE